MNVVIHRLPRGMGIVFPASHCPVCGRKIKWYDNVPIFSWFLLRGQCRFCKTRISSRYVVIESVTAVIFAGVYVWYYMTEGRAGAGRFVETWPTYAAHVTLFCGLLVCSAVDVEQWIVPLEVCWFVSATGIIAATAQPTSWVPGVSPTTGAMAIGAAIGIIIGCILLWAGVLRQSFIGISAASEDAPQKEDDSPKSVAVTKSDQVSPRREVLLELLFLLPTVILAAGAYILVEYVPAVGQVWKNLFDGAAGPYLTGFVSAVFGYLVGGAIVWAARIFGTLGFGKEAMGLGDVHLLASVGAVAGWLVPVVAFFAAPFMGLLWALWLWSSRKQRELPYGPWLAAASVVVMLFYDGIIVLLEPYIITIKTIIR